ncbi:hypothetical protein AB5567_06140 [Lactiplantibacillus plantarum]|uniref:hypothetical protein n=1 Tax=Lactiplantibacillus plantarum TaxID=1590 RepID=UPI00351C757D
MEIVQIIIFWGIGLFIYLVSLFTRLQPADWNGWLGFFGSLLGSIIAIFGVYWQVSVQSKKSQEDAKKQKDLLSQQLKNEKESQYRQARPFFLVSQEETDFRKTQNDHIEGIRACEDCDWENEALNPSALNEYNIYSSKNIKRESVFEESHNYLVIRNVSTKNMYAVKVFVASEKDIDKCFIKLNDSVDQEDNKNFDSISINKIEANSDAYLLFCDKDSQIKQVLVWYITEIRESIKLYFEDADGRHGLEYKSDFKLIGNQKEMEGSNEANYNLAKFKESKKLF